MTLRSVVALVALIGAFAWPALLNGQPFFFPDTTAYIRGADAGIQAAFKHKSSWSVLPAGDKSVSSIQDKTVLTGRSPYYGALLYAGDLAGGFWLSVAVQALAVAGAVALALRAAGVPLWPQLFLMLTCIAAATTAPFFVSLLMPDVFAGVAILAASVLLSSRRRLAGVDYGLAFILLAAACMFHDSHVLIVFSLLAMASFYNRLIGSWTNRIGLAIVGLALVVALLAQSLFSMTVQRVVGAAPLRPPFLMARTIEDGPGYRYILATCPANGFKVCAFANRLPLMADDFLWKSGTGGVFAGASPEVRRELSNEQWRFLFAVIAYDPWAQLSASLKDAAAQLSKLGLTEFQYLKSDKEAFSAKIPREYQAALQSSAAYRGTMPTGFFATVIQVTVLISALIVVLALPRLRRQPQLPRESALLPMTVWMIIGIVVNAAVCGILSGPHDRYSARVAWLLPFGALLLATAVLNRQRSKAGVAAAHTPTA